MHMWVALREVIHAKDKWEVVGRIGNTTKKRIKQVQLQSQSQQQQ